MKKKELGASLRRGVVVGTIAGSIAGWGAFSLHSRTNAVESDAQLPPAGSVPAITLPRVPDLPALGPIPHLGIRAVTTDVAAPAFLPLPPLPAFPAVPKTTTRTS